MTPLSALSVLALTLGQATPAPQPPGSPDPGSTQAAPAPAPEAARPAPPAAAAPGAAVPLSDPRLVPVRPPATPVAVVQGGAPALRLDRTTRCLDRGDGRRWRAQCDALTKTCLVAPDAELEGDGEPRTLLDRASPCVVPGWREEDLAGQGFKMIPALAETPPGWRRDERQRLMQVNFDLNRRLWLGAGYRLGDFPWSDQGEANAGIRWDRPITLAGARALLRIRALETRVAFDGDQAELTAIGLDLSRAYPTPLLRLTTFLGKPRRFDVPLELGGWIEALHAETLRTAGGRWYDRFSVGAAALTLDLWRSRDLGSYLRLRGGAGYETVEQLDGGAWTPLAAADLEVTLDRGGIHHLRASVTHEWITPAGQSRFQPEDARAARLPADRERTTARAEYEVIFLAVNDQPLTLVLDGRAQRRDDVPDLPTRWLFQGTASLRFNLFAPPRRDAPVQDAL